MSLTLADITTAAARIATHVRRTPVVASEHLDAVHGARLLFKCENLQAMGAFKARGAANAVFCLTDAEAARGVVTHSSGNHGAAVARAARLRGIAGTVVMPRNAPSTKVRNVERYGAAVVFCAPSLAAREAECARLSAETGARLVHPFDDFAVMAGQGTAALELLQDHPGLDLLLVPVGGGGLLAGTAVAAKALRPGIQVVGVEPAGAGDAAESFRRRERVPWPRVETIADGLRTNCIGERNLPLLLAHADAILTVPEDAIVTAMRTLWEELKLVIEPSCAVPFAAIQAGRLDIRGRNVGVILTGGNVDLDRLPWQKD